MFHCHLFVADITKMFLNGFLWGINIPQKTVVFQSLGTVCCYSIDPNFLKVMYGANKTEEGQFRRVELVAHHIKFGQDDNEYENDFDIALIKVKTPFVFTDEIKKIALLDKEPETGDVTTVSGYGITQPNRRSVCISCR